MPIIKLYVNADADANADANTNANADANADANVDADAERRLLLSVGAPSRRGDAYDKRYRTGSCNRVTFLRSRSTPISHGNALLCTSVAALYIFLLSIIAFSLIL